MTDLKHHIFLTGMPGCGKTTLGHALQERGYRFVDLDRVIEIECGCSVAELVSAKGIDFFRQLESTALRSLISDTPCIIACGGGTPCHDGNMELMKTAGITVLLRCERRRHLQRISQAGATRPMFASISNDEVAIATLLDELETLRGPIYNQADIVFDSTFLENSAEISATTDLFIARLITAQ